MNAYVYNSMFDLVQIIDSFVSFIWNDVYIGYGDFEIEYVMDENALANVEIGSYIAINESSKTMIVEAIEIITGYQTGNTVRISGRSLESILERRVLRNTILSEGSLQHTILRMLNENIISAENPNRNVPGFSVALSNDPHVMSMNLDGEYVVGENLYDVIYKICSERHIGFRVTIHNERFFLFELYYGKNRSYNQTENAWVIFSPKFENLEESNMKIDVSKQKNVVEVAYETTENIVDPSGGDAEKKVIVPISVHDEIIGLDRKEIFAESKFEADAIDKELFGKAEDRVDKYKYMTYKRTGFASGSYNAAMRDWTKRNASVLRSYSTPRDVTVTIQKKPGDPGYVDPNKNPNASWLNTITTTRKETGEEVAKRTASKLNYIYRTAPQRSSYETYEWVLTDSAGYNKAIEEAQKNIDAAFENAQQQALNYAVSVVSQKALEELVDYKTITFFDGKIDPNVNFIYRRDYDLGDLVQIVNDYNFNAVTRVVGVLFSQDNQNGVVVRPSFESDDPAVVDFDLSDV